MIINSKQFMTKKTIFIALVVSLGGFLFGFDAGIISGVMVFAGPEFYLSEAQIGWVVSSPSWAAMISMLFAGRLSDRYGRKSVLMVVAILYALSALFSAFATSYEVLYIARMVGGFAFGAALILAPVYIAEISKAEFRGRLVSIQQLNIVLGFFAAFFSNYLFNKYNTADNTLFSDASVWRWMLGVELIPAVLYFFALFRVPKSPRWLYLKNRVDAAMEILIKIHGETFASTEIVNIANSITKDTKKDNIRFTALLKKSLRLVLVVGLIIGILQQITGINAVYFYATSIFEQTGIGRDAAFSSGVLLSSVSVVFTIIVMYFIDKLGRRPLLLLGTLGIAVSLLLCAYSFNTATYNIPSTAIEHFDFSDSKKLEPLTSIVYNSDVEFKNAVINRVGNEVYNKNSSAILQAATKMNANLVLIGILGFVACFAFSLGPVMWVLLSELYPIKYRGLAIGFIAFVNSLVSSLVQFIFPLELSYLGSAMTFLIFGGLALVGFMFLLKFLPETKGKSLEELETELIK